MNKKMFVFLIIGIIILNSMILFFGIMNNKEQVNYDNNEENIKFCTENNLGFAKDSCWNNNMGFSESFGYVKGHKFPILIVDGIKTLGSPEATYNYELPKKIYFSDGRKIEGNLLFSLKNPFKEFCEEKNGVYDSIVGSFITIGRSMCYITDEHGIINVYVIEMINGEALLFDGNLYDDLGQKNSV